MNSKSASGNVKKSTFWSEMVFVEQYNLMVLIVIGGVFAILLIAYMLSKEYLIPKFAETHTVQSSSRECASSGCVFYAFDGNQTFEITRNDFFKLKSGDQFCVKTVGFGERSLITGACPTP